MRPPNFCCAIVGHNQTFMILSHTLDQEGVVSWSRTLGQLAAKLQVYHAYHCDCGLDMDLEGNIWPANLTWDHELDLVLEQYRPHDTARLQPDTQITDLDVPPGRPPAKTIFLMFGRDNGDAIRKLQFCRILRMRGDVCRVSYSTVSTLPAPDAVEMPRAPGTVYVDRSDLLLPWFKRHGSMKQIPVIRRPPRFGKSTFLHICAATYGDRHGDPQLPWPRESWTSLPVRSLVIMLDFAKLDFCAGMPYGECLPDADMITKCKAFMKDTAAVFWRRYAPNEVYPPPNTDWECHYYPHHAAIKEFARDCGRELFLGIDNYTQPFHNRDTKTFACIEFAIWRAVIEPFLDGSGLVTRGLVTGAEMRHVRPFEEYPRFAAATEDLTYDASFAHAIGLSAADVADMSQVLLGADFDVDTAIRLPGAPDAILCTGDVLDALRAVHAKKIPETPRAIRWMIPGLLDDCDDMPGLTPSGSHDSGFEEPKHFDEPKTPPASTVEPVEPVFTPKDTQVATMQ